MSTETILRRKHAKYRQDAGPAAHDWRAVMLAARGFTARRFMRTAWRSGESPETAAEQPVLTTDELAAAMQKSIRALTGWISEGRLPAPTHLSRSAWGRTCGCYTAEAARGMVSAYAAHLRHRSDYYRASHVELRDALYAAVHTYRDDPRQAELLREGDGEGA